MRLKKIDLYNSYLIVASGVLQWIYGINYTGIGSLFILKK